jgi:hypothetical protein
VVVNVGGLKKPKISSQQAATSGEKGKEIRIVTRHVVTVNDVVKNPRLIKLLYLISLSNNGLSEKALSHLVYNIEKEQKGRFGYEFTLVGDTPVSKELLNDLTTLKYTGLVEVSIKNRKLYVTSGGREILDKIIESIKTDIDALKKSFEETWPKIAPIDVEAGLKASKR